MAIIRSRSIRPANSFLTRHLSLPILRALYSAIFSLLLPIGWALTQFVIGRNPFSPEYFDPALYIYMLVMAVIPATAVGFFIGKREHAMTELALRDGLTGLYNKRYFQTRLEQEFGRFQRYGTPLALIQLDLDHFKRVNDTWGHQAGDMVLKAVSNCIKENLRSAEIPARVGGEEICIIVSDTDADSAFQLAERLRKLIEGLQLSWHQEPIPITASFGISVATEQILTRWQLYERTDKALYQAKESGRNKTVIYSD